MNWFGRGVTSLAIALSIVPLGLANRAYAVSHRHHSAALASSKHSTKRGSYTVVQYLGSKKQVQVIKLARHRSRHHKHEKLTVSQPKTRYAYPVSIFMLNPPAFEQTPFAYDLSTSIRTAFNQGLADSYPARSLVRAGIVGYHPLKGGFFGGAK